MESIYAQIAARTGGNIYIGVVGPVRTGKSTLIKRIMETMVIPNISDPYRAERARDELPQSGSGKTIMTSEPKFVPEEAVEISPDGTTALRVRMIDSVGYMVEGAVGAMEGDTPRMVTTPWYDQEIPLTEAAELGTRKVMEDHSSIGLVVTTDGSITDIPRQDYVEAEKRAILDMKSTGKPFVVLVNSKNPAKAQELASSIGEQFGVQVIAADCQAMEPETAGEILKALLYTFPMSQLQVTLPRWMEALEETHPLKAPVYAALLECARNIPCLGQARQELTPLQKLEHVQSFQITSLDPGTGIVSCELRFPDALYYEILSARAGMEIGDDGQLLTILTELSAMQKEYALVKDALESARSTGYGVVMPDPNDMTLEPPQVVKKGNTYGVKLKAAASSIHMIRVDVDTELSPMVGGEQQSQELGSMLSGGDSQQVWNSNLFGKSVHTLVQEGITAKLIRTPPDVRNKFRASLTKIVNDGANGLICIIL